MNWTGYYRSFGAVGKEGIQTHDADMKIEIIYHYIVRKSFSSGLVHA